MENKETPEYFFNYVRILIIVKKYEKAKELLNESKEKFTQEDDKKTIAVQVNGKLRSTVEITSEETEEDILKKVLEDTKIKTYTDDKTIVKKIYIKDKIVNIVVK